MPEQLEQYLQYLDQLPPPWNQVMVGVTVFVCVFIVLRLFHVIIIARVRSLTKKSNAKILQGIHQLLSCLSITTYLAASAFAATHVVQGEPAWVTSVFSTFIIIALSIDLGRAAVLIIGSATRISLSKAGKSPSKAMMNFIEFALKVVIWSLTLLLILSNLGFDVTALIASLGIGGIAVALAMQQILGDIFNSVSMYIDQPFETGDFIVVGGDKGTVEHIGLQTTRLRAMNGEELIISNTELANARIQNFKKMANRRVTFDIGVEYGTKVAQLQKAKELIQEAIESTNNTTFQRAHFKKFGDSALIFEVVYLLNSNDFNLHMDILEEVNWKIASSFEEVGIVMAFPTMTIHMAQ